MRIQAARFGDLDHATMQVLNQTDPKEGAAATSALLVSFDQKRTELTPGTVLVREWDRRPQRVMVIADGFAWNGQTYDSLSKVAFAITGTRMEWSALFRPEGQGRPVGSGRSDRRQPPSIKPLRCAIYTRVSTEHGLDQEFNSLDAQYDAASAYTRARPMPDGPYTVTLRRRRLLRWLDRSSQSAKAAGRIYDPARST